MPASTQSRLRWKKPTASWISPPGGEDRHNPQEEAEKNEQKTQAIYREVETNAVTRYPLAI